jgi:hypothetical protein
MRVREWAGWVAGWFAIGFVIGAMWGVGGLR